MNQVLPYLFFLSCPVSMGAMMWLMMRGAQGGPKEKPSSPDRRIAQLEREVHELRAERREAEPLETR
jgi:hypothetical protein